MKSMHLHHTCTYRASSRFSVRDLRHKYLSGRFCPSKTCIAPPYSLLASVASLTGVRQDNIFVLSTTTFANTTQREGRAAARPSLARHDIMGKRPDVQNGNAKAKTPLVGFVPFRRYHRSNNMPYPNLRLPESPHSWGKAKHTIRPYLYHPGTRENA